MSSSSSNSEDDDEEESPQPRPRRLLHPFQFLQSRAFPAHLFFEEGGPSGILRFAQLEEQLEELQMAVGKRNTAWLSYTINHQCYVLKSML